MSGGVFVVIIYLGCVHLPLFLQLNYKMGNNSSLNRMLSGCDTLGISWVPSGVFYFQEYEPLKRWLTTT